jgi:hypothetical protein
LRRITTVANEIPMKSIRALLILAALFALVPRGQAQVSPISMRIEQVTKSETEKFKHIQKHSLKFFLTNGSSQDRSGLVVRYFFFGKEAGSNEAILLDKGERPASVASHKTEIVETPVVSKTFLEAHYDTGKGGAQNKGATKLGKKVEASGEKFVGYGGQLFDKETLLAEYFSEPSFKPLVAEKK